MFVKLSIILVALGIGIAIGIGSDQLAKIPNIFTRVKSASNKLELIDESFDANQAKMLENIKEIRELSTQRDRLAEKRIQLLEQVRQERTIQDIIRAVLSRNQAEQDRLYRVLNKAGWMIADNQENQN